jgi:phage repressor protein C with HTH and peptisase S24 domain
MAVVVALVVFLKRRSRRRKQTPGRISMVDPYPPSEVDTARSPQAEYTALTQQINRLQERQVALRTQPTTSATISSSGTKSNGNHEQVHALQEEMSARPAMTMLMPTVHHTPSAPALLVHTDSGLRLTPAREVEELPPHYSPD